MADVEVQDVGEWPAGFWSMNLPLQMWPVDEGWRVLNYMPRKEKAAFLEANVSKEDVPAFCKNTSAVLRNLADLFDLLGEGRIDTIYYPDESPEDAIKSFEEEDE